jgi:predicted permease
MDITRFFRVLEICISVFALIGLGKFLDFKNIMTEDNRNFINKIVYNICIPGLILSNTIKQPFNKILNFPMIASCIIAIICISVIYFILSLILKPDSKVKGAFITGTFWANVAYMGFPLAAAAFGAETGLLNASVINAFINIVFVTLGVFIISAFVKKESSNIKDKIIGAVTNPVVFSSLIGIVISFFVDLFFDRDSLPEIIYYPTNLAGVTLQLAGSMGLPLALIAIGGSLKFQYLAERKWFIAITTIGKVIIMPLLTLLCFIFIFPNTGPAEKGVAVLLMAMPSAVVLYLVNKQMGGEEGFMSSVLVISTVASIFTIPVWLYIIL